MKRNIKNKCILCGGISPNCYGECFFIFDLVFFSGDYKKIAERLAKLVKQQFNYIKKI